MTILVAPVLQSKPLAPPPAQRIPRRFELPKLPVQKVPPSPRVHLQIEAPVIQAAARISAPPVVSAPVAAVPAPPVRAPEVAFDRPVQQQPVPAQKSAPQLAGFGVSASANQPVRQVPIRLAEGDAFGDSHPGGGLARTRATAQAVAGFGNAGSTAGPGEPIRIAAISAGGFGDSAVAKQAVRALQEQKKAGMDTTPVEITHQPRPVYTEEARRLKIEGQVLVSVVFAASGDVKVLRILRGLGHGLDENALAAVAAIRFRPAHRQGESVDAMATIRMNFELAF